MPLTDYTTFKDIRAALGISAEEIEDETLSLAVYEYGFKVDVEDVDATGELLSAYSTVKEKDPGTRTTVETRFFETVSMFATYSVARHLTVALPLFSPKDVSDGKATMSRYAANPYDPVIKEVNNQFDRFKNRLIAIYAEITSTSSVVATPRLLFTKSTPTTNVITGS